MTFKSNDNISISDLTLEDIDVYTMKDNNIISILKTENLEILKINI